MICWICTSVTWTSKQDSCYRISSTTTMKIEKTDKFCSTLLQRILTIPLWHLILNCNIMCILIHIFCNLKQQMSQRNVPHPKARSTEGPNRKTASLSNPRDTPTHTGTLNICLYFSTSLRLQAILKAWFLSNTDFVVSLASYVFTILKYNQMCFNAKQHQNIHAKAIPFEKKVWALQFSKTCTKSTVVDICWQRFDRIPMFYINEAWKTLHHGRVRHQINCKGHPSQKELTPRNQDIHRPKPSPKWGPFLQDTWQN